MCIARKVEPFYSLLHTYTVFAPTLSKKSIPCNIFQRTFLFNCRCDYVSWQSLTTCTLQMHSPPVCPWHWGTPEALPLVVLSVGEEGSTHGLDVTSGSPWSWWFCCCVILLLTCLRTASERSARCKQKHMCVRQNFYTGLTEAKWRSDLPVVSGLSWGTPFVIVTTSYEAV